MQDTRIIMRLDGVKQIFESIEAGRLAGAVTCDEFNNPKAETSDPKPPKAKAKK